MDLPEADLNDPAFATSPEILPGGAAILTRDISAALRGEDFAYYPDGAGAPVHINGISEGIWQYYLGFFGTCEDHGLPHGSDGWARELPWVPDFLSHMKRQKTTIELWRMRQEHKGYGDNQADIKEQF